MSHSMHNQVSYSEENEIDLNRLLLSLLEHKWLIIGVTFIMLCMGVLYTTNKPPQYQANVLLQVDETDQNSMRMIGEISKIIGANNARENTSDTQSALIQSRFVIEPVVQSLGLDIHVMPYKLPIVGDFFSPKNTTLYQYLLCVNEY